MKQQLDTDGYLDQADAVDMIEKEFGDAFVYDNERGNPAIDQKVLRQFRKLTEDTAVWDRWERSWRKRAEGDAPGRQQE